MILANSKLRFVFSFPVYGKKDDVFSEHFFSGLTYFFSRVTKTFFLIQMMEIKRRIWFKPTYFNMALCIHASKLLVER